MNEKEEYIKLINEAKTKNRKKSKDEYFEFHHILPKSIFPLWINRKSNLVLLTPSEHIEAHRLLSKIYGIRMHHAYWRLIHDGKGHKVSSEEYKKLKMERSEIMRVKMKEIRAKQGHGYKQNLSEEERQRRRENFLKIQKKDVQGHKNGHACKVICLDTLEIYDCINYAQKTVRKGSVDVSVQKARKGIWNRCDGRFWMEYDVNLNSENYQKLLEIAKKSVHDNLSANNRKRKVRNA